MMKNQNQKTKMIDKTNHRNKKRKKKNKNNNKKHTFSLMSN